jgi:hypothetical protein
MQDMGFKPSPVCDGSPGRHLPWHECAFIAWPARAGFRVGRAPTHPRKILCAAG